MDFRSDNTSAAAPEIMAAVFAANSGQASSYGNDQYMDRVTQRIRILFQAPEAAVYLVTTGTAANALSQSLICPPWGTIYCDQRAHVDTDECGAPEFFIGGGKTATIPSADGKITPDALRARLAETSQGDVHNHQHGILTLTNLTETGNLYSPDEIAALCAIAHEAGMKVHLDGARLANALAAAACEPADMTWKAGIDVLSLGGTKNGCLGVEAVVIFDPANAWEFELRRKRGGHLLSKHRFLSAQMDSYLSDDLWLRLARHANAMAARLEGELLALPHAELVYPRRGNMVFARFPRKFHRAARAAGAQYHFMSHAETLEGDDDELVGARLVCSWSTTEDQLQHFVNIIRHD